MNATIILVVSTITYVIVGGVIIHYIESDFEKTSRNAVRRRLEETFEQFIRTLCAFNIISKNCPT